MTCSEVYGRRFVEAFFSGAETALTSVSDASVLRMKEEGRAAAFRIEALRRDIGQTIGTLLVGNNLANTAAGTLGAALAIAAVGVTWSVSGWTKGPMMLMAMSIMLSIFSNKEHPAYFVGQIFLGAATGSAIAVFCRIVLLPGVTDPFTAGAIIAPFILIGVFAMSQRRIAIAATDATLFFIFVTQPGVSVTIAPADLALGAVAMVMGVGSAWIAYQYLIPINPAIRLRSLMASIMRDVERLAVVESSVVVEKLMARLHHRAIRLRKRTSASITATFQWVSPTSRRKARQETSPAASTSGATGARTASSKASKSRKGSPPQESVFLSCVRNHMNMSF